MTLSQRARDRHTVAILLHHIAVDGLSLRPLLRDLAVAYSARTAGRVPDWAPLPVEYASYVLWQREVLGDAEDPDSLAARQLGYWAEALDELPAVLPLPLDRPRPAGALTLGHTTFAVGAEQHRALVRLARENGVTPFMVLHAAVAVLLRALTGTDDIVVGTSTGGRADPALDDLVGMFVGTLALRTRIDPAASFADLLEPVRAADLGAFEHADVPFEQVVRQQGTEPGQLEHPLFQVMLAYENFGAAEVALPGLAARVRDVQTHARPFDLDLTVRERRSDDGSPDGLHVDVNFPRELFDAETIDRWMALLQHVLLAATSDPSVTVGNLDLLAPDEHAALVPRVGLVAVPVATLPDLFDGRHDGVAVRCADVEVTYRELDARATRLARRLIARGIGPEDLVALMLPRSVESIVAVWAVTRSGAAFLPVDPGYPPERIAFMLHDSEVRVALAADASHVPEGCTWIDVADGPGDAAAVTDSDRVRPLRVDHPAYVLYTSGSTGMPKGVVVTHRGLAPLAHANAMLGLLDSEARVAHVASPSFDLSINEMLLAFTAGATLVIVPPGVLAGDELADVLRRERVTHVMVTPSVLASLEPSSVPDLRVIDLAGEELPWELAQRWTPDASSSTGTGRPKPPSSTS